MTHYVPEYPTSSLGESILPEHDYLPKPEELDHVLKLSDAEMGFYPTASGHSSFGAHFGLPHVPVPVGRSPMNSMLSGHSNNSGPNLLLMQKIESLQNQVYEKRTNTPS